MQINDIKNISQYMFLFDGTCHYPCYHVGNQITIRGVGRGVSGVSDPQLGSHVSDKGLAPPCLSLRPVATSICLFVTSVRSLKFAPGGKVF